MNKQTETEWKAAGRNIRVLKPLPPKQKAKKLESFSVTTDSVVATANIIVNEHHKTIRIWWGDEGVNDQPQTIDLRRERLFLGNPQPKNTLKLQHVYEINTLRKIIIVQSQDDEGKISWNNAVIDLEPRYKFIIYPVTLEINSHLDSGFENDSELEIHMEVIHNEQTILDEQWKEDITTQINIIPFSLFFTLEGSRTNLEMFYHDESVQIKFYVKENDGWFKDFFQDILEAVGDFFTIEFDGSTTFTPPFPGYTGPFHPRVYTGPKDFTFTHVLDDGTVHLHFSTELNLIVPLENNSRIFAPV